MLKNIILTTGDPGKNIGGIVAFVALVIMLIYLVNKFIHDKTICLLLALLFAALSSLIDQHLMELSFINLFTA